MVQPHFTVTPTSRDTLLPTWFWAQQRYPPWSAEVTDVRYSFWSDPTTSSWPALVLVLVQL